MVTTRSPCILYFCISKVKSSRALTYYRHLLPWIDQLCNLRRSWNAPQGPDVVPRTTSGTNNVVSTKFPWPWGPMVMGTHGHGSHGHGNHGSQDWLLDRQAHNVPAGIATNSHYKQNTSSDRRLKRTGGRGLLWQFRSQYHFPVRSHHSPVPVSVPVQFGMAWRCT